MTFFLDRKVNGRQVTVSPDDPLPVDLRSAEITLNVADITFGYVGIEDALGNKLVIENDGSCPVTVQNAITIAASALPAGAALDATIVSGNATLTSVHGDTAAIKNQLAGSLAVTGAFWQSTQPVSLAAAVAVTGTFWQATQPVSGTITANLGATDSTSLADVAANTTGLATQTTLAAAKTDLDTIATNSAAAATIEYQRLSLAAQREAIFEGQLLRQLLAASAGGFIPTPETFRPGVP